jgi:organic hydroperoxide reductase OsmC/OhrA
MTNNSLKNSRSVASHESGKHKIIAKQYYEVNLLWNFETKAIINSLSQTGNSGLWQPPASSKEKKEKWTAEHLFIVSVNSSLMSTFLLVAGSLKLEFISFESNARGKIETAGGKLVVTEILLKPKLVLPVTQNEAKAKKVLALCKKACINSGEAETKIILESIIIIK